MADQQLRKRIWGWYFFDWASQPYHTVLLTFIFGPYFVSVAASSYIAQGTAEELAKAQAQSLWSACLTAAGLIIGFGAPLLGAIADKAGRRAPWIWAFSALVVLGAASLWFTLPDGSTLIWMLVAFAIGFIGAEYALIFINAQLPGLGPPDEVGQLSGNGFAFGYAGGVLALIVLLLFVVEQPSGVTVLGLQPLFGLLDAEAREGTRAAGPIVALWYAVFMIPYFAWVHEVQPRRATVSVGTAMTRLWGAIKRLRHRPSLAAYLGSSMLYRDALNGLYSFGGTFAALVMGFSVVEVGIFGIAAATAAAAFSYVGGIADRVLGPKPVITASIWGLILVCFTLINLRPESAFGVPLDPQSPLPAAIFYACGCLIGGLGGVLQAASRTLMVRHCDPAAPTESFGLYGLCGRATAFIAPASINIATTLTQNVRLGVSPLILLFILGLILLRWVDRHGEDFS